MSVAWVNIIAIGVLVLLSLAVLKFAIGGAITKRHVWEAVRVITGLACMALVGLSSRGNIGPWGSWVGFGVFATVCSLLASFENREPTPPKRR
jgi:hypothetical protein